MFALDYSLPHQTLLTQIEGYVDNAEEIRKAVAGKRQEMVIVVKPVRSNDAVGRKFSFPFEICRTWEVVWRRIYFQGVEKQIKDSVFHVEPIRTSVDDGCYNLINPGVQIILPQVWEATIKPDWAITMHMWPMTEGNHQEVFLRPVPPIVRSKDRGFGSDELSSHPIYISFQRYQL
ncbi:hypothetical protein VTL71DRAFT_8819 [Oculimacula yallundae]|uniref:Ubiquitin-like domain-containing protein n=1 Tax=Oculimacula yallundae TaxID=86028 RepID=A0ABR4CYS1_9HELO